MKIEKVEKHLANLHDKKEYFTYKRNLQQALNHELILKKVHRVIKFHQKAWIKPPMDMNAELVKKQKGILKIFFQVFEQCSFWKSNEKFEKTYPACNNRSKKEIFGIRK